MPIRPRNWESFQHYKERNPTWIKLHKKLLDDFEFQCLPVASRALAPMLWLLASEEKDGIIRASDEKLAFRLRMTLEDLSSGLKPLIEGSFFDFAQDASDLLAACERDAIPEKETETQEETETQDAHAREVNLTFEAFWKDYPTDPSMSKNKALTEWHALSSEDRAIAQAAAPAFKAFVAKQVNYRVVHAWRYLGEKRFVASSAPDQEAIAAAKDRADKLLKRGKYAEQYA